MVKQPKNADPDRAHHTMFRGALLYLIGFSLVWLSVLAGPTVIKLISPNQGSLAAGVLAILSKEVTRTMNFLVGYGVVWAAYWRKAVRGQLHPNSVRQQFLWAAVFVLFLLPMPPYFSDDVIGYAQHGRVLAEYAASPYLHTLSQFNDPWAEHRTYWANQRSPYGPVMTVFLGGASWLAGDRLWLAVAILKVWMAASFFITAWLIVRILKKVDPIRAGQGLFLFLWNPMVLLELVGQGHNDAFMIVLLMTALYLLVQCREAFAILGLTLSALTKFGSGVLFPLFAIYLWRRRKWKPLALGAILAGLLVGGSWFIFFRDPNSMQGMREVSGLSWLSLGWLGKELLEGLGANAESAHWFVRLFLVAVFAGFLVWRMKNVRHEGDLFRESTLVILAFLLLVNNQMNAWYLTLLIPVAALNSSRGMRDVILAITLWPILLYFRPWLYDAPYWANVLRTLVLYTGILWILFQARKEKGHFGLRPGNLD